ncbi:MAG: DNA helicase RecQ [Proteobacteria bacterium]|nr:DNA helicase RecQ [Pseudomonadota bacterium]
MNPLAVLRNTFGFDAFREPQEDIINALVAGQDALVLMPTGRGKSLCFQIPAIVRPGCGIVISPLIALMQNQTRALQQLGVRAAFLNSTLDPATAAGIEAALEAEELDLLYLAPERLTQARTLDLLRRSRISLFAIDEAHCVSQWGHDFRADYLQLDLLARDFPQVPRIALTATADARTQEDIALRLQLQDAQKYVVGFDRPNIRYQIALKQNPSKQLLQFLRREHQGDAGIVYCLSRKKTEDTASWLREQGFNALPYHAGLDPGTREANQDHFLQAEGVIIVATIAFGMGIDKPDVRFVAHLDLPKTIESYYQETGRAGRDGEPANAWMVYGLQDVIKLRQMLEGSEGSEEYKRIEQHRLNAMLGLCEITTCRRQALLAYFGEDSGPHCGHCDTCLYPVDTWDATEAARKALSTVYRTGQRFGVNHLVDVLLGKETEKIFQFDHHQLPVFGIGRELDANRWKSVFRQLVARGLLSVDLAGYGGLKLEEKCRPLLRGDETIALRQDVGQSGRTGKRLTKTPLDAHIDVGLWEALREKRRQLAEHQGVPPYVIFHDATLRAMAEEQPRTLEAFASLPGVGTRKLDKYGEAFLGVIADSGTA